MPYDSISEAEKKKTLADYPVVVREFHLTKNDESPEEVHCGSTKKLWWVCKYGHEWMAQVRYRISEKAPHGRAQGCPKCRMPFSSMEVLLYTALKTVTDCLWRSRVKAYEVDVLLPGKMTAIEVDGAHWHIGKSKMDEEKNRELGVSGYRVVRLREEPLLRISGDDEIYRYGENEKSVVARFISSVLGEKLCAAVDWDDAEKSYWEIRRATIGQDKSLLYKFPQIAKEWHWSRNRVGPDAVTASSHKRVWWCCEKGHEWQAVVYNRTIAHSGCPYCSGRVASDERNLSVIHPDVVMEWHESESSPSLMMPKSHKVVIWKCRRCGGQYKMTIAEWTRGRRCPHCRYERMAETRREHNAV
jgi:DNA-directed RNA polymerase subunit RPC12/RpoP